jgi:hypothetical protein
MPERFQSDPFQPQADPFSPQQGDAFTETPPPEEESRVFKIIAQPYIDDGSELAGEDDPTKRLSEQSFSRSDDHLGTIEREPTQNPFGDPFSAPQSGTAATQSPTETVDFTTSIQGLDDGLVILNEDQPTGEFNSAQAAAEAAERAMDFGTTHEFGDDEQAAVQDVTETTILQARDDLLAIDWSDTPTPAKHKPVQPTPELRTELITQAVVNFQQLCKEATDSIEGYLSGYEGGSGSHYTWVSLLQPGESRPSKENYYLRQVKGNELIIGTQRGYTITRPVYLGSLEIGLYKADNQNQLHSVTLTDAEFKEALRQIIAIAKKASLTITLPDGWNYLAN